MKEKIVKWLPIIFGCHQNPERSFFIKGEQFPICARCTGELVGILMIPFTYWLLRRVPFWIFFIMLIPLITDGGIQAITKYESNNIRRFITGLMFGIGLFVLFLLSTEYCFMIGFDYGRGI